MKNMKWATALRGAILVIMLAVSAVSFGQDDFDSGVVNEQEISFDRNPVTGSTALDLGHEVMSPTNKKLQKLEAAVGEIPTKSGDVNTYVSVVNNLTQKVPEVRNYYRGVYKTDSKRLRDIESRLREIEKRLAEHGKQIQSLMATKAGREELAKSAASLAAKTKGGPQKQPDKDMQTISIPSWLPWALLVITLSAVALYFATRRGNGAHQNFNGFAGGGQPRQPLMDPEGPEFTGQIDQAGEAVQASRSYRAMRFTPDGGFEKVSTHMKKHTGRQ